MGPIFDGSIEAGRDDVFLIWTDIAGHHLPYMTLQGLKQPIIARAPELDGAVEG